MMAAEKGQTMARTWLAARVLMFAVTALGVLQGCGLRTSGIATRPPGHVKEDAGPDVPGIDAPNTPDIPIVVKRDGSMDVIPVPAVDCQGTEEQVNDCIINAPTKSGIPATRGKPTLTYQTCGAQ
jgi:hypothetical protein